MTVVAISRSLAGMAAVLGLLGLALLVTLAFPRGRAWLRAELAGGTRAVLGVAWLVAAIATAGSLFYSNVAGFEPCVLCWWQRIAMYPLVLVLGIGWATGDARVWRYGLPLAVAGLAIAIYHVALQHQPALDVGACGAGVPCTLRYVQAFGYITIPTMAGFSFLSIGALLLTARQVAEVPGNAGESRAG